MRQLPVVPVLIAASTALIAVAAAVYRLPSGGTVQFALVCAVFGFVWLIVLTFQVGLAFRADPSGHVAMLVPALQLLGSACGPLVASFAIEGDDATGVPLVSGGFALAAVPTCCCRPPGSSRARTPRAPHEGHALTTTDSDTDQRGAEAAGARPVEY